MARKIVRERGGNFSKNMPKMNHRRIANGKITT